ncbi:MAG TPA: PilZ domain-containing protein, partial [Rhizomicrobium sp.]
FGRFEGVVTRSVKGEAGIAFVCSAAKRKRLEETLAAFVIDGMKLVTRLRRFERAGSGAPIDHFSLASGAAVACILIDISLQGALLQTNHRPPVGDIVHLGQTRAWVVRHLDDGIAIQFLQRAAA